MTVEKRATAPIDHGFVFNPSGRQRFCSKCKCDRPEEGGVQLGPNRWGCGRCWRLSATSKKKP